MLGTGNLDTIAVQLYQERRQDEEWKQQIGHGDVNDEIVYCSPQCFRLEDNYCDQEIARQRNDKNEAVSKCFSDFGCLGVIRIENGAV